MLNEEKVIDQGFSYVLGEKPRILVLGTMPSVKSLQEQQYYGHPRNAFWWIMSELCQFDPELPYMQRLLELKRDGIALWDVAHSCHRPGSLDSNIDQSTLQANDINDLVAQNPSIEALAFNGQAAYKLFKKFIDLPCFPGQFHCLPSTSPANAAMSKEQKLEHWAVLRNYLN